MRHEALVTEVQPNGLPVELKDWTYEQLSDAYDYLEEKPPRELNAASMLNIYAELEGRPEFNVSKEI